MRVEITCDNRVGILHEITAIFADYRVNVASGELGGDSGDKVYLSAPGMLNTQFNAIEKSLLQVPGLKRVRRISLIPSERRHFELDTLLRHVSEPVLSVDREGRIVAANLAAARAFGVGVDRVPGMQLQRFLPLLQVAELLRDFAVPRYGVPVTVRGSSFRLEWVPIALADSNEVESLAGAVLTLQADADTAVLSRLPPPVALWDFDLRRRVCLDLQQMAGLVSPLLITGEEGSGKSTFAGAAHYLSPVASRGECLRLDASSAAVVGLMPRDWPGAGTLILDEPEKLPAAAQLSLLRHLRELPRSVRPVATCRQPELLQPGLAQFFSSLVLELPPLRSMRPAMDRFATAILWEVGRPKSGDDQVQLSLSAGALERLHAHDWPRNFAGLLDFLAVAARRSRARGETLVTVDDLPELAPHNDGLPLDWARGLNYREAMDKVERGMLQALVQQRLSTREMARRLGISHTAVANKLRRHGLAR
ncbi:TyrR/PhhR family helix-turn-helix DNA-binding protein [Microbulbifer sediminum]|uniref:TyrR/PhhR family helix-turn-helix DNA-binding protein n=1 Tax=Microbulbifer sediminum TaxID=2904250 RepID=UPI001F2C1B5E|nr:TyrR/PhhR family helix-turn-helix DNA-binding protein [Microbulbifer sediminum]